MGLFHSCPALTSPSRTTCLHVSPARATPAAAASHNIAVAARRTSFLFMLSPRPLSSLIRHAHPRLHHTRHKFAIVIRQSSCDPYARHAILNSSQFLER